MALLATWLGAEEMQEDEAHTVALFDTLFLFAFVALPHSLTLCSSAFFKLRNVYINTDRPMHTHVYWHTNVRAHVH